MHIETYADTAIPLFLKGWAPIPNQGKRSLIRGWPRFNVRAMNIEEVRALALRYPDAGVGLAVPKTILVVDIDHLDEKLAASSEAAVKDALGDTPLVRVGRWPKRMLFYRTTAPVKPLRGQPVELFSGSGQVVLYGIHPETKQPYRWLRAEPTEVGPNELPAVTPAQVEQLRAQLLQETSGSRAFARRGLGAPPRPATPRGLAGALPENRKARWLDLLRGAEPGNLHNTMVAVTASMVANGLDDAEIFELFDAHFAAPTEGVYADVWDQIPGAVAGIRAKIDREAAGIEAMQNALGLPRCGPAPGPSGGVA